MTTIPVTRRVALGQLGALLAAGLWPGTLCAQAQATAAARVRFAVLNDFHHESTECDGWFETLFRAVTAHPDVAFIAGLGDLANKGKSESLAAVKRIAGTVHVPFYSVPGNHDNDLEQTTRLYADVFPNRLNYFWVESGWQFVALDTTDGNKWSDTTVRPETLAWLKQELPKLNAHRPTVLLTHFPLGAGAKYRPLNAEAVLAPFVEFNLRGVYSGHYHGVTKVPHGSIECVTNVCCSRVGKNHDGTAAKGYYVCTGGADGKLTREWFAFAG